MSCSEQNPMASDEAAADRRGDPLDPAAGDMDLSGEEHVPKARKPYTITKQREKWTEDEHRRFLEALQLHGRAWRRIQEHIGTKTAVQIRSHAQKFFTKVVRESSACNTSASAAPAIQIPPPRPKRKPAHPYPRKVDGAAKKHVPALRQLEKPPLRAGPLRDQDDGSPTSVLTAARTVLREDALGSAFANSSSGSRSPAPSAAGSDEHGGGGGGSPASSVDREDGCVSQSTATAEMTTRAPYTKVFGGDENEVSHLGSEAPVFKLFGKKVAVKDSYEHLLLQDGRDLKTDASTASVTQATRSANPFVAADGSSWNPWSSSMHQVMYFVPQHDGFAAQPVVPWFGYNGSLPCALFYPQAVASNQQASERPDHPRMQREGSLTGSNTASSAVQADASAAQNSDAAESHHGPGQENTSSESRAAPPASGPRLTKCASSASFSRRGFVPYRRCAAESETARPVAPGEEADGELTRLCL